MKELANGFAEFAAIIMMLIAIAVSTAAVAQWAGTNSETQDDARPAQLVGLTRE